MTRKDTILFRPDPEQKRKIAMMVRKTARVLEDLEFTDEEIFLFIAALTEFARARVQGVEE